MFTLESHLEEAERGLARIWRTTALRGLFAIAFGVIVLIWPGIGLGTMIALVGILALASGGAAIAGAFRAGLPAGHRWWMVFEGMVAIAAGVVVFVWPGLSALALLFAIAAWAVAAGIAQVALAFVLPFSGARSVLLLLGALLSIAFGVVMFAHPGAGAITLLALVAAYALVTGVTQIVWALELRRVAGAFGHGARRPSIRPVARHSH